MSTAWKGEYATTPPKSVDVFLYGAPIISGYVSHHCCSVLEYLVVKYVLIALYCLFVLALQVVPRGDQSSHCREPTLCLWEGRELPPAGQHGERGLPHPLSAVSEEGRQ